MTVEDLVSSMLRDEGGFQKALRNILDEELNMSLNEFCQISGISQSTVYKILEERREPNLRTGRQIEVLGGHSVLHLHGRSSQIPRYLRQRYRRDPRVHRLHRRGCHHRLGTCGEGRRLGDNLCTHSGPYGGEDNLHTGVSRIPVGQCDEDPGTHQGSLLIEFLRFRP